MSAHIHYLTYLSFSLVGTFKSYSSTKFQLNDMSLTTTVAMFYIRSSGLIHLITESLFYFPHLVPVSPIISPLKSLFYSVSTSLLFVCLVFVFCFFKDFIYKRYHSVFVLLWLHSLSIMSSPLGPSILFQMTGFTSFIKAE